jgi:hypothetical protein
MCVLTNSLPNDTGTLVRGASPSRGSVGSHPDAGLSSFFKPSPEETFDAAIELFQNAPQSKTKMGVRILDTLKEARKNNLLSFAVLLSDGESDKKEGTIRITDLYDRDRVSTSVWLVHEAYHLAVAKDNLLYVDEEIESRQIQGEYWTFLENSGLRLRRDSVVPKMYRENRIIDYIIPWYYKKEPNFKITADWIVKHKTDWGGLCNRTLDTRKFYAKTLVESQPTFALDPRSIDPKVAETLLELLECNKFESFSIVTHVGKDEVKTILEKVPEASKKRVESLRESGVIN